jgi:3-deoxy-D-manno-octulosonic-acid transferase
MVFIYNLSIFLYQGAIRMAALLGNVKAGLWMIGRKDIFKKISESLLAGERRVWFHCASLGEFEQGRPLIEKFRLGHPEYKIVLTFFSPSGYEVRKNYSGADYVFYLPADTKMNATQFISMVNPEKVFFVKYEFWFHYFNELRKRNVPVYLVSGIFRPGQRFFKWYGSFSRRILRSVTYFFVQDEQSAALLKSIGLVNYSVTGDTRFDRVLEVASNARSIPLIEKFKDGKKILVAGSTWEKDEQLLLSLFSKFKNQSFKLILVPHEISSHHIGHLEYLLVEKCGLVPDDIVLYSRDEKNTSTAKILIIDTIGILSAVYRYGEFAYVGGGFGSGIHNILEAAVYGLPVFFGPNYERFLEAVELIKAGGAFPVRDEIQLTEKISLLLEDENEREMISLISKNFVLRNAGATQRIMGWISNVSRES